jgi:3-oxoadipate CoA-transferase beta subunit
MDELAREVALDLPPGSYVNLGIGLPQRVAGYVGGDRDVVFHSENGVIGVGPPARPGEEDGDLIDAGKLPVTLVKGGSYISHADSFALIRGGHLDYCIMGAFQVSTAGDLANWTDGEGVPAVGGAMDLAVGARRTAVMMWHTDPVGRAKLVAETTLPLTALRCVDRIYTDLGIFDPHGERFVVRALVQGVGIDEVRKLTAAPIAPADDLVALPRVSGALAYGESAQ